MMGVYKDAIFQVFIIKVSRHSAAREMVAVAEASLDSSAGLARAEEKLAWAEMLNSATEKVNLAETERAKFRFTILNSW